MAKYRLTSPDGATYEISAPDNASQADVLKYAQAQFSSRAKEPDFAVPDAPGALARLGRGFMDVAQGLKQGGAMIGEKAASLALGESEVNPQASAEGEYTHAKSAENDLYEKGRRKGAVTRADLVAGREGDPGIDWLRLAGNVAGTLPAAAIPGAGAASMGARIASGAAQGAAASGAMFTPEGQSKGDQIATGAAVGGAVPVAVQGIKRALSTVVGRFQALPAAASPQNIQAQITAELRGQGVDPSKLAQGVMDQLTEDARKAIQTGGTLDPAQLARKADIANVGGTPFKAAITRAPKDWQEFQNLASGPTGQDLIRIKEQNALALTDALQRVGKGGKTPYAVGESVFDAVAKKEDEMQKVVGSLYRKADEEFGKALTAQPRGLLSAAEEISVRADADPIITTINRYLTKRGILDKEGQIVKEGYLNVKESEELRKLIRDVSWDKGRSMRDIGNKLISALDDDVFSSFPSGHPFATARSTAAQKFEEFSSRTLQKIVDEKMTPDKFVQNIVFGKGNIDELRSLQKVLTTGNKDQIARGAAAMADIKGEVMDRLLLKATGANSLDDIAGRPFSGRAFSKALDGIEWQKLNIVFSPKELDALRQVQRAAKSLTEEVPYSDVNYSRTGAAIANLLSKVAKTPLLGEVIATLKGDIRGALNAAPVVAGPRAPLPASPYEKLLPGAAAGALAIQGQQ